MDGVESLKLHFELISIWIFLLIFKFIFRIWLFIVGKPPTTSTVKLLLISSGVADRRHGLVARNHHHQAHLQNLVISCYFLGRVTLRMNLCLAGRSLDLPFGRRHPTQSLRNWRPLDSIFSLYSLYFERWFVILLYYCLVFKQPPNSTIVWHLTCFLRPVRLFGERRRSCRSSRCHPFVVVGAPANASTHTN